MRYGTNPANISQAIAGTAFPTVMMWNRLEARPRAHDFSRALKAEVRDALWMLTKQWQMGEFKADDAGAPVFSKVHISYSHLDAYRAAGNENQPIEPNVPLEAKVEQKKIPFTREGKEISLDIRLQMGRYWQKMLMGVFPGYVSAFVEKYGFSLPDKTRLTDHIYANKEIWQQYAAISGRCIDGYKLYAYLAQPGNRASDGITATTSEMNQIDTLGSRFKEWYEGMYYQPDEEINNAWLPQRLEYQFGCESTSGAQHKKLEAAEYYNGHLDWHAFDIAESKSNTLQNNKSFTSTFFPVHVKFDGMPDTRWWKFEDGKTSFGNISPSTTDLSKLLLIEFGLVYANDWFIVPFKLPIGSLANVRGLTVKNNFGETFWIKATEEEDTVGLPWSIFKMHAATRNNTLFLAPTAAKVHESDPLEEILLIRDEMSNMVWGIESRIPSPFGRGDKGNEAALRIRQFHETYVKAIASARDEATFYSDYLDNRGTLSPALTVARAELQRIVTALSVYDCNIATLATDLESVKQVLDSEGALETYTATTKDNSYTASISYLAQSDVPEHWIPFVPVHVPGNTRETQLQRASMLRIIDGDIAPHPVKVKPQTSILREGLDNGNTQTPYFIHEEEVPRSGICVTQSFQRTRWINGEVYVWLGMKKKVGRGEGSSGLAFDSIKDVKNFKKA